MAKILICDDSPTILNLLERHLKAAGHEVVARALDGEEGLRAYQSTRPELVLMDVTMPNKDGRECLVDILKGSPSAKIIMVSAVNDPSVVDDCLKSGAKAFVTKGHIYHEETFRSEILHRIEQVLQAA